MKGLVSGCRRLICSMLKKVRAKEALQEQKAKEPKVEFALWQMSCEFTGNKKERV